MNNLFRVNDLKTVVVKLKNKITLWLTSTLKTGTDPLGIPQKYVHNLAK